MPTNNVDVSVASFEAETEQFPQLAGMIGQIQVSNDRLGRYSDHEGNEGGSTFFFWQQGADQFDWQCKRAIEDHREAILTWQKIRRLNKKRLKLQASGQGKNIIRKKKKNVR